MNVAASALKKKTSFLNVFSRCENILVQQYVLIDILPLQVNVETLFLLGLYPPFFKNITVLSISFIYTALYGVIMLDLTTKYDLENL